jgi:hypothetical protein
LRNAFEPIDNPIEAGVVIAVVNGDLDAEGDEEDGKVPRSNGRGEEMIVTVDTSRRAREKRRPLRVPVLAGDIASTLKLHHGFLSETVENRELIRADAVRRIEALRRDGDPRFKNIRTHDLYLVSLYASNLFWIASDDEVEACAIFKHAELRRLKTVRRELGAADAQL